MVLSFHYQRPKQSSFYPFRKQLQRRFQLDHHHYHHHQPFQADMTFDFEQSRSAARQMRLPLANHGSGGMHVPLRYIPPVQDAYTTPQEQSNVQVDTPSQEPLIPPQWHQSTAQHSPQAQPARHVLYQDTNTPPEELQQVDLQQQQPESIASASDVKISSPHSTKAASLHSSHSSSNSSDSSVQDSRGYRILLGKDRWNVTVEPFVTEDTNDKGRARLQRTTYLEGLRGLIAFQTLLWIFFRAFAPAIVTDTDLDGTRPAPFVLASPGWMSVLRKVLAPILFDGTTQMALFIILIGRTGMLTFCERRKAITLAGQCFRRPVRIILPVALTMALISILCATNGFRYATFMADDLRNIAVGPVKKFDNALEFVNSVFSLLFEPYAQRNTRAVDFLPLGRIAWFIDVAFQQTYVLIVFSFLLPFTVFKYKLIGFGTMLVLSAWLARWSWYTVTGLCLAEFAVVYRPMMPDRTTSAILRRDKRRVSLTPVRKNRSCELAMWIVPGSMMFFGLFLRYTWTSIAPQYADKELLAHGDVSNANLTRSFNPVTRAYPRYDAWLLCTGFLIALELSDGMQQFFANRAFVYFGRLAFSIALTSGTIMISLGALLHTHLVQTLQWTNASQIVLVEFLAIIPVCIIAADIWSRIVDDSALRLSHFLFRFALD